MATDPTSRRARNLVLMVIALVAVPSLLLTGLGVVAVTHEQEAVQKRLEQLYHPTLVDLARRWNNVIDELLINAEAPLQDLAEAKPGDAPSERFQAFFAATTFAANYFVIDRDGGALVPRAVGQVTLPATVVDAIESDAYRAGAPAACNAFAELAADTSFGERTSCLAQFGLGLCQAGAGLAERAALTLVALRARCPGFDGETAREAEALMHISSQTLPATDPTAGTWHRYSDETVAVLSERSLTLGRRLGHPGDLTPPDLAELAARMLAGKLITEFDHAAFHAWQTLLAVAERGQLLSALASLSQDKDAKPVTRAVRGQPWRRVVLVMVHQGKLVGCELVAMGFRDLLAAQLEKMGLPEGVQAAIGMVEAPPAWDKVAKAFDANFKPMVAAWVLLKKTDLAWELVLFLHDPETREVLGHNRFWLYLWGLVLVVVVLIAGIAMTVVSVVREARLSRLKTDFVSSVSHDLRTPLTSIRMYSETLLMGRVKDRDEEKECLRVIAQETERLSRLTERILDFSRMEAGRKAYTFKPEQVSEVVEQALAASRPLIEEARCRVEVDVPANLPAIDVDRDALIEVVINLLSNAIKYSPDDRQVRIAATQHDGRLSLSMRDHGIGIARAEHQRIFEKFYRVDCRRTTEVGGSGLGLSLVQHIVHAHRGEIRVESTPGHGSTFTITLPLRQPPRHTQP